MIPIFFKFRVKIFQNVYTIFKFIKDEITNWGRLLRPLIDLLDGFIDAFAPIYSGIQNFLQAIKEGVISFILPGIKTIAAVLEGVVRTLGAIFTFDFKSIGQIWVNIGRKIADV